MNKIIKSLAAFILVIATLFLAGCKKEAEETEASWIDLGLPSGLLWADHNLGAGSAEDYGSYFAWGETKTKKKYSWSTYQYCNAGNENQLTKYCSISEYGFNGYTDNLVTLEPGDDAATAKWGNDARTPTDEEWDELIQNTTSENTTLNGVAGWRFTGANGNSIFLPSAGNYNDDILARVGERGYYLSSSLYTSDPSMTWCLVTTNSQANIKKNPRENGCSVRPVKSTR